MNFWLNLRFSSQRFGKKEEPAECWLYFCFGLVVGFWGAFVQSVIFKINYEKLGSINCGGGGNANRQEKITGVSAAET